jgi:hypothetical protein
MGCYGQAYDSKTSNHGKGKTRANEETKRRVSTIPESVEVGKATVEDAGSDVEEE